MPYSIERRFSASNSKGLRLHGKQTIEKDQIRENIRNRYAAIAETDSASCGCNTKSGSCCSGSTHEESYDQKLGYTKEQVQAAPEGANLGLGCGNPLAIASIRPGETVLDLGSGAGFDCFLAARELKGTGHVIGVDMTPAMVSKARRNAARSGYANVDFRLGEIEALPLSDGSVDLIISNCVINLSPDKPQVFREAFRVLKTGGRLSISDILARKEIPASWRADAEKIGACISGAELESNIRQWLQEAGFTDIRISTKPGSSEVIDTWDSEKKFGDFIFSAIIEARRQ